MEFTRRGKILEKYGKGLVDSFYQRSEWNASKTEGANFWKTLRNIINQEIGILDKEYNSKDRNKIVNYMAERFLELGQPTFAYKLFKEIDSKKAKTLEDIFPRKELDCSGL